MPDLLRPFLPLRHPHSMEGDLMLRLAFQDHKSSSHLFPDVLGNNLRDPLRNLINLFLQKSDSLSEFSGFIHQAYLLQIGLKKKKVKI